MPQFLIEYTKTEVTRERVWIEADSPAEALRVVEEYEFDNSESYEVDSLRWEISDAEVQGETPDEDDPEPDETEPNALPVAITCDRGDTIEVVHRTATIAEAEEWISVGLADGFLDENDVDQGRYGIDAPEEMVNP
jgi:hypothetical protein